YPGLTVNRSSYPASEAAGYDQTHQYLAYGPVASVGSQMFTYHNWDLPTVGGTSGSGVYVYGLNVNGYVWNEIIVGINIRSQDATYGQTGDGSALRLTSGWTNFITNTLGLDAAPWSTLASSSLTSAAVGHTVGAKKVGGATVGRPVSEPATWTITSSAIEAPTVNRSTAGTDAVAESTARSTRAEWLDAADCDPAALFHGVRTVGSVCG